MSTVAAATGVRPEIAEIFADVFQYAGPVTSATSSDDVARWDSLQHIALIRTIEETFDLSLTMDEMAEMRTAGDIETLLARYGI